jgi:hypothetical protein
VSIVIVMDLEQLARLALMDLQATTQPAELKTHHQLLQVALVLALDLVLDQDHPHHDRQPLASDTLHPAPATHLTEVSIRSQA